MSSNIQIIELDKNSTSSTNQRSTNVGSGNNLDSKCLNDSGIESLVADEKTMLSALDTLYKKYSSNMDQITNTSKTDLKRNFDQYLGAVQNNFAIKIDHSECKKLKMMFVNFDDKVSDIEKKHGGMSDAEKEKILFQQASAKLKSKPGYEKYYSSWENFFIHEELKFDFFYFYTILVKVWLGEPVKKSEIEFIQPCKVLITRSLIKRKFGEEIDMR
jgi:hypothetical protein